MAHWRYPAYFLAGVGQHETGRGAADPAGAQLRRDQAYVDFRRAAGKDQQGRAVELEDQAVGDGGDVAPQRCGRGGRRRDLSSQDPDCVRGASRDERVPDVGNRFRSLVLLLLPHQ